MHAPVTRRILLMAAALLTVQAATAAPPARKPDLADMLAGSYAGDVISDSKGSSHDGVTLTLARIGPNEVRITSDYPRLPVIAVKLVRVMNTIQAEGGDSVFLYDQGKAPPRLDVSFHNEVSWSGGRE
ncbi:MAG: hypothetical protein QM690_07265 [Sphingobium sp.]